MIHILISGANGKIGQILAADIAQLNDMQVVCGVDIMPDARQNAFPVYSAFSEVREDVDVIIDFSRPEALPLLLAFAQERSIGAVLATTGYTDADRKMIAEHAQHTPLFFSANMSFGVNLQMALARKAAEVLHNRFDIEIIEKHHNLKVDAPSGTALALADAINDSLDNTREFTYGRHEVSKQREQKEIGIHAVRGGTVVGEHDILFLGPDEIIEINHKALSKQVFAQGAIRAAEFLHGKPAALYSMQDIFAEII